MEEGFLDSLMDLGVSLLGSGAEISRVEETIQRIGLAHGARQMHVFVITSCIIVTAIDQEGNTKTQLRRILSPPSTNFALLEELNHVSRDYCQHPEENLPEVLSSVQAEKSKTEVLWGAALAAGFFAMFFGGTIWDALAAVFCGVVITLSSALISRVSANQLIYHLLSSFLSGVMIAGLKLIFPILHTEMIMIGEIMLLIPGIAMTSSVRDILTGNTISGLLRLIETGTWALALAGGFMLSMWLFPIMVQ